MKKLFLSFLLMLLPMLANAFEYNGINYSVSAEKTASVINNLTNPYTGDITIPSEIIYLNEPYKVTSIGYEAFKDCTGLKSVSIPNTVTSIGNYAFENCTGLSSITIPNSVTDIGSYAFHGCTNFKNLIIPNGVLYIYFGAFDGCTGLTKVEVYASLDLSSYISSYASYNFFNGCTNLKEAVFDCEKVSPLFKEFKYLEKVTLKNTITTIQDNSFASCTGLKTVVVQCMPTNTGYSIFSGCTALKEVTIDCETTPSLFQNTTSIEKVNFTNSVKTIGGWSFSGCTGLTTIDLPTSVTKIESSAFQNCTSLASIVLPDGLTSLGSSAFVGCTSLSNVVFPNGLKTIENSAFSGCTSLNNISLPYKLESLGSSAFSSCTSLYSIIIPNSVTVLRERTFGDCQNLSSVTIGSGVTKIASNTFTSSYISKVIWLTNTPPSGYSSIYGSINYVSNDQFTSLSNKVIYPFLSSIFEVDGIRYVPVSLSERTCDAIDCVYDESASITKLGSTVTYKGVTLTVQKIQPHICYNNKYINHLTMEVSGSISHNAFQGCSNMQTAIFGTTNNDTDKDNFTGIYIGSNITSIGDWVFYGCESLNKLNIADRVSELTLGSNNNSPIFGSCPLESVYIGGNITYSTTKDRGYSPFYRNTTIRSVTITDKETEISQNEFYGCTNLQRVSIGDGVTDIGDWAFSGCQSLSYFAFGSQLQNIGTEAFSDCTQVGEIISKARTAPVCGSQALDDINKWDCKLYVPDGTIASYQEADQWKEFLFAEEGTGTAEQNPSGDGPQKCGTPKIAYSGDKISFTCETEGVKFFYRITGSDVKAGNGSEIGLQKKYTISVYATKEGYVDSDVAKSTIEIGSSDVFGDLTGDGIVNVADHVELSKIIMEQGQ